MQNPKASIDWSEKMEVSQFQMPKRHAGNRKYKISYQANRACFTGAIKHINYGLTESEKKHNKVNPLSNSEPAD